MAQFIKSVTIANGRVTAVAAANVASADMTSTGVTAGSYTLASITVDAAGRITAASSGSAGAVTSVDAAAPAAGLTITGGPITGAGTFTFALADDLAALEALTGTDTIYYRSGASTWSAVTVGAGLTFTGGTLAASGSVTSVGISNTGTGLTITGSPVTGSGTINVDLAARLVSLVNASASALTHGALFISAGTNNISTVSLTDGQFAARESGGLVAKNLGDFQPYDAELTALAGLASAADRVPYFTGTGAAALATFTAAGRALVDDADAAAQRTTLGLGTLATQSGTFSGTSSGTNTGDQTITLTGDVTGSGTGAFAATIGGNKVSAAKMSASATNVLFGRSTAGAGAGEEVACTAAGRALLDDADAAAQRTTLGLGTLATQSGTFSGTSSGTNTGDQTIILTGDVTGSGTGAFAATIGAGKVTNAMLAGSIDLATKVTGTLPRANEAAAASCAVYHSTTQSVANATWTALAFDSEADDTDAFHSTSSNTSRVTVPSGLGGLYLLTGSFNFASNGTGLRVARFLKNGATQLPTIDYRAAIVGDVTFLTLAVTARLSAGDYVELQGLQTSGGALNVSGGATQLQFSATRLGS